MTIILMFLAVVSSVLMAQAPIVIPVDDFNKYKDTSQFLRTWGSRSDGYKEVLENNSYYYYIKPDAANPSHKYLCSSLREYPKDFVRKDLDPEDIKMVTDNVTPINSVIIYKDYWGKTIKIGKLYHREGRQVFLDWDWVVYKHPAGADEYIPERNDSAMSVYAVVSIGMWRFRTIKFTWSGTDHKYGVIPRTLKEEDTRAYIVANKKDGIGVWKHESVNLSQVIKEFLPQYYDSVTIVAISVLSDTDAIKKASSACVDNIKLVIK